MHDDIIILLYKSDLLIVHSPRKVFDWFRRFTLSRSSGNSSSTSDYLQSDIETTLRAEASVSCPHAVSGVHGLHTFAGCVSGLYAGDAQIKSSLIE